MWFMTIVLLFPTAPNPVSQTMNYTVVVLGGVCAIALGYYYVPVYGGVHWFQGPVPNIDSDTVETVQAETNSKSEEIEKMDDVST